MAAVKGYSVSARIGWRPYGTLQTWLDQPGYCRVRFTPGHIWRNPTELTFRLCALLSRSVPAGPSLVEKCACVSQEFARAERLVEERDAFCVDAMLVEDVFRVSRHVEDVPDRGDIAMRT